VKHDPRFAHLVPLSAQALQVLHEVLAEIGHDTHSLPPADRLVFARGAAPLGEGAIRQLYIDAGLAAAMCRTAGAPASPPSSTSCCRRARRDRPGAGPHPQGQGGGGL
jgi:hypothetical protein